MSLIVDASILTATVLPLPYSDRANEKLNDWNQSGLELVAPILTQYEVVSAFRRAVRAGDLPGESAPASVQSILRLITRFVTPSLELHERALYWAERLRQSKAYDAQYLALAEQERAEFWTADERLYNNARQLGLTWVRWIGEE
jgi:predicted nucleic acid-binding protein